jgi:predicted nucleic acid-binding protein
MADVFIAATALAAGVPLYTRNPADFVELEGLIEIVTVMRTQKNAAAELFSEDE